MGLNHESGDLDAPILAFCDGANGPEVFRFDSEKMLLSYVSGFCSGGDVVAVPQRASYGRQIKLVPVSDLAAW